MHFGFCYPEGGMRKDLNYIQRKFAYGINVKSTGNDRYELRSVAYSKLPLLLKKDAQNQYQVYTAINKKECVLSRYLSALMVAHFGRQMFFILS